MFVEETWKLFLSFWFPFTLTWAHIGTIPNTMCDTRNASAFSKFNCENFISRNSFFSRKHYTVSKKSFCQFHKFTFKGKQIISISYSYPLYETYTLWSRCGHWHGMVDEGSTFFIFFIVFCIHRKKPFRFVHQTQTNTQTDTLWNENRNLNLFSTFSTAIRTFVRIRIRHKDIDMYLRHSHSHLYHHYHHRQRCRLQKTKKLVLKNNLWNMLTRDRRI